MTVEAMNYPPVGTSVEQLAQRLIAEVETLLSNTGAERVHLVGHSLGGTATLDVVVPGLRSVPSHREVETIRFDGIGHLGMLLCPQVIDRIATELWTARRVVDDGAPTRLLPIAP
jgi:hypothetical protein